MNPTLQANTKSSAPPVHRFEELDGLRGLASLTVFFSHVYLMQRNDVVPAVIGRSFLRSLWDGDAAVFLFFVLSGFVLALPYLAAGRRPVELFPYLMRRVFRIYPAYIFALVFSLLLMQFVFAKHGLSGLSDWICSFWTGNVSFAEFFRHLTMIGPDTNKIDPPVWTLRLELIISSIFPLIIYVLQWKNSRLMSGAVVIAFAAFCVVKPSAFFYFGLFITGGLVAKYHATIVQWVHGLGPVLGLPILILAFYLYSSRFITESVGASELAWHILVAAGAALLIVSSIAYKPFTRLLRTGPVQFLGYISYSFYLLHFPILLALGSIVFPLTGSLLVCAVISLLASVGTAYLAARYIEGPFQRVGKHVAKLQMVTSVQASVGARILPYRGA